MNELIKQAIADLDGVLPDKNKEIVVDGIGDKDWFDSDVLGLCVKDHEIGMSEPFAKYFDGEYYLVDSNATDEYFAKVCSVEEFEGMIL